MKMSSEKFCLKWNEFESNISGAFRELREEEDFFDVTLACENEQMLAHKVILSACSPFFRGILRKNRHEHPLLYLKGVRSNDLVSVLNFMYNGEANIAQEDLNSFLSVAEELEIKGLTQRAPPSHKSSGNSSHKNATVKETKLLRKQHISSVSHSEQPEDILEQDDIQEIIPVKTESKEVSSDVPKTISSYTNQQPLNNQLLVTADDQYSGPQEDFYDGGYDEQYAVDNMECNDTSKVWSTSEDVGMKIETLYEKQFDSNFICISCGYISRVKQNMRKHVETHIVTPGYACELCLRVFKTKNSLNTHKSTNHRRENKN